jgi:hypothetical protein
VAESFLTSFREREREESQDTTNQPQEEVMRRNKEHIALFFV